nr:calcium-activated chloride channel regulator 1-like [Cherax quadricarinatus]
MRFWTLLVVLELLTFSAADITVVNQKYEGITVAFSPSLHSSMAEITIHLVQAMMRSASQVMFAATRGRVYFGNVKFIIPLTWAHLNFTITTTERFEESVIRIDKQSKVYLGQPYTVQPGLCGDPGRYIHLSPEYLTDTAQAALWGPPDKALVKEWARVRWGVFEEYGYPDDPISPLVYCHPGQGGKPVPRLNYCAHHTPKWPLTGRCCQSYNTTSGDCSLHHLQGTTFTAHYYGNTRVGFCGPASSFKHLVYHHNEVAPTRHNVMCGGNSLWHVLSRHKDFSHPPSDLRTPPTNTAPTFTLALQEATKYILVFDFTGSLSCINRTLQAAYSWILHQLSSRSYLGIIKITDTGLSTVDLTLLTDTNIRRSLVLWLGDGYIHGGTSNKVNVLNITVKADHTDNSRLSTIFYKVKSMVGNGTSGSLTNVVLVLVTGGRRKTTSDDLLIIETEIFTTFDDLASESTTSERPQSNLASESTTSETGESTTSETGESTTSETGESTTSDETETEDTETTTLESLVATEVRGENTATLDELLDSGLHLVTITLEKMADKRFESRAERTFTVLDCDNGDKLEGAFQSVLDYQPIDLAKIRLKVDQWSLKESFSNVTVEKSFTVAQDMGKNLVFRMYKDCADDFVYGPRLETPHGTLLKTPMYHDGSTYIPLAEPGIWKWRLRFYPNNSACHYVYASVFSQRRYGDPIVARAWGSGGKLVKVYNTPVAIYAEVKQANNPVVNATVRARVRLPGDRELEMMLLDDGKLGDNQAKDGIYSRYLTTYTFLGRYYVKVKVSGNKSTYVNDQCLTCATLQAPFRGQRRCCGGEVPLDCKRAARAGTFTMTISTFWFQVTVVLLVMVVVVAVVPDIALATPQEAQQLQGTQEFQQPLDTESKSAQAPSMSAEESYEELPDSEALRAGPSWYHPRRKNRVTEALIRHDGFQLESLDTSHEHGHPLEQHTSFLADTAFRETDTSFQEDCAYRRYDSSFPQYDDTSQERVHTSLDSIENRKPSAHNPESRWEVFPRVYQNIPGISETLAPKRVEILTDGNRRTIQSMTAEESYTVFGIPISSQSRWWRLGGGRPRGHRGQGPGRHRGRKVPYKGRLPNGLRQHQRPQSIASQPVRRPLPVKHSQLVPYAKPRPKPQLRPEFQSRPKHQPRPKSKPRLRYPPLPATTPGSPTTTTTTTTTTADFLSVHNLAGPPYSDTIPPNLLKENITPTPPTSIPEYMQRQ